MTELKVGDYVRIVGICESDAYKYREEAYLGKVGQIIILESNNLNLDHRYIRATIKIMHDIDGKIDPYFFQVKVEPVDILEAYAYEFNR